MTRARDRLYLSSTLKDGVVVPGRGSLAEVLPDSLRALFGHAATAFAECAVVGWTGQSGRSFDWRICRPPAELTQSEETGTQGRRPDEIAGAFGAIADRDQATRRVAVSEWLHQTSEIEPAVGGFGDLVTGILVHRLLESSEILLDLGRTQAGAELAYARRLLRPEEQARLENVDATVANALTTWRAIHTRPDVVAVLESGWIEHEVPFSIRKGADGATVILRGTIDCLIHQPDGGIVVLEFKTGRRRPMHQQQLDAYVEAAEALFPNAPVRGMLIYPD
jgi:ATP-dependent exoDNAse (exonuclease V) beta subunit